jgi:eukaryotic-like serine/threonine-protein kinase
MSVSGSQKLRESYEFGPFRVDPEKETLLRGDEPVPLQPKTFQILLVLIRHPQQLVSKYDLMKAVWPDTFVEEANLSRSVFLLRKALGESPQDHQYILTVPGRGYRFAENVRLVSERESASASAGHYPAMQINVRKANSLPWIVAGLVLAIAMAGGGSWFLL